MAVSLPDLPYASDALAPHISEETLSFHHGKHHKKYVDTTNEMVAGTDLENADLETIIKSAHGKNQGLFNNAAQVWNHNFYWKCMKPGGGGQPPEGSKIAAKINEDFGSYSAFREEFAKAGATQFGSGWAWLVEKNGKLEVQKTPNAELPVTADGENPLLIMDVWEHAYYLDYQNARPSYIDHFLDNLVNWDFVEENLNK